MAEKGCSSRNRRFMQSKRDALAMRVREGGSASGQLNQDSFKWKRIVKRN